MNHSCQPYEHFVVCSNHQGRRLGPGGAGECLRTNFRLVTDTVRACDGHLLSDDEHAMLETFHVSGAQMKALQI